MMIGNPRAGGQYSGETFTLLPPEPCDLREEIKTRGEAIISREIQVGNTRETAPERKIPTKIEYASQDNIHVRPGIFLLKPLTTSTLSYSSLKLSSKIPSLPS